MTNEELAARKMAILRLAIEAEIDVRTAAKAIDHGLTAIGGTMLKARIEAAANRASIRLAPGKVQAT